MPKNSKQPAAQPAAPRPALPASQKHVSFGYDVLVALLGGAQAAPVTPGDASTFAAVLDSPRAWLSPGTGADEPSAGVLRQYTLEVLSLKLRCLDALVRVLIGSNHTGGLSAKAVFGRMQDEPGRMMPARWSLELVVRSDAATPSPGPLGKDLAILFARLLLTHDEQSAEQAEAVAADAASKLTDAAAGTADASQEQLHELANSVFAASPLANSNSVLHPAKLRNRAGATLPSAIWRSAIKLILRLRTNIDGFSFGPAPLLDVHGELTTLARQLDIATFGAIARRDEIAAVVRKQLDSQGLAPG